MGVRRKWIQNCFDDEVRMLTESQYYESADGPGLRGSRQSGRGRERRRVASGCFTGLLS